MAIRCLDLFCGAGGASMGLFYAGFEVTGVDIRPQPHYPFRFIQRDALTCELGQYDFVWASPPCQAYSTLRTMPNLRRHEKLIQDVRDMLIAWGGPWILENVEGARRELIDPVMLCGSMFGLGANNYQIRRHRYFESNIQLSVQMTCNHGSKTMGVYGGKARDSAKERRHYAQPKETRGRPSGVVLPSALGLDAMGVPWMTISEASECIPPVYSLYLGRQVMAYLRGAVLAPPIGLDML